MGILKSKGENVKMGNQKLWDLIFEDVCRELEVLGVDTSDNHNKLIIKELCKLVVVEQMNWRTYKDLFEEVFNCEYDDEHTIDEVIFTVEECGSKQKAVLDIAGVYGNDLAYILIEGDPGDVFGAIFKVMSRENKKLAEKK